MTPDANDLCVFAIKRGSIENRLDINYNLPQYAALVNKLRLSFGDRLKPIGEIADVICGPFGSAIKNGDYQESGIPLVRITNISKDGYMDYSDLVYISESLGYAMGLKKDLILVHNGTSEEAEKHIPSNIRMFEQVRFDGDYQTLQNEIKRRLIDYYRL